MEQIAFAVVTKLCEDWDFYTDSSSEKAALVVPENDGSASLPVLRRRDERNSARPFA